MEKRGLHSPDPTARSVELIAEVFPQVITDSKDAEGRTWPSLLASTCSAKNSLTALSTVPRSSTSSTGSASAVALAANTPIVETLCPMLVESVGGDTTKNLFIEGDNFDALRLLHESYLGEANLIYIDPPYNTVNDSVYEDDFAASSFD